MTEKEIVDTVSTPYMGFELGATKIRQAWDGKVERLIFESPLVRLMKDYGYRDVFRGGSEADGALPAQSIAIHRYYEQADPDLGSGKVPSIEEAAQALSDLVLRIRDQVCGDDAEARKVFKIILVAHSMGGLVVRCFLQNPAIGSPEVIRKRQGGGPNQARQGYARARRPENRAERGQHRAREFRSLEIRPGCGRIRGQASVARGLATTMRNGARIVGLALAATILFAALSGGVLGQAGVPVAGTVTNGAGRPVPGVAVSLIHPVLGRSSPADTDQFGHYTVGNVPPHPTPYFTEVYWGAATDLSPASARQRSAAVEREGAVSGDADEIGVRLEAGRSPTRRTMPRRPLRLFTLNASADRGLLGGLSREVAQGNGWRSLKRRRTGN